MGSQQVGLIVIGAILVSIAIIVAVQIFGSTAVESSKMSMVNEMNAIANLAVIHKAKGLSAGGGAGTYTGFTLPRDLRQTENATYELTVTSSEVTIRATSIIAPQNTIVGVLTAGGSISEWTYTGDFQ